MEQQSQYSPPSPTYPDMPVGQPCGDVVYMDIDGIRHVFECTIPLVPHKGLPHVVSIAPVESGDAIGIYWWHEGE
jgi:hypothetical protein